MQRWCQLADMLVKQYQKIHVVIRGLADEGIAELLGRTCIAEQHSAAMHAVSAATAVLLEHDEVASFHVRSTVVSVVATHDDETAAHQIGSTVAGIAHD